MEIKVPKIALEQLSKKHEEFFDLFNSWQGKYDIVSVKESSLSNMAMMDIELWLGEHKDEHKDVMSCYVKLNSMLKAMKESDTKEIKRLADVPATVFGYVRNNLPHSLVYREADGTLLPYAILNSSYSPPTRDNPAVSTITLMYYHNGSKKEHITLHTEDLKGGKTVLRILNDYGYLIENSELNKMYSESVNKYADLTKKVGRVYVGSKTGYYPEKYYRNKMNFKDDPTQNKVVVDFEGFNLENENRGDKETRVAYSEILSKQIKLPLHAFGMVFSLTEHRWIEVHVDNIEPYQFQGEKLLRKLILPEKDKTIVKILIEMSKMRIDDIVSGKTGGSFIMATGIPGTGKTLTAEVFSETIEKALYNVQCSQLGINVETVEKRLKQVLARASRWGAILLIDEADVYVRERGTDINQNAIVGTFLRTLEYYNGILFMTSNMGLTIDDAIMSRATAHLIYGAPSREDQIRIWEVLAAQFGVANKIKGYEKIVDELPDLVGRDIKGILKLSIMYAQGKGVEWQPELMKYVYEFLPNVKKNMGLKGKKHMVWNDNQDRAVW